MSGGFFYFDLGQYQSLEYIKEQQANFLEFYKKNTLFAISLYMEFILFTGLSLPGAAFLTYWVEHYLDCWLERLLFLLLAPLGQRLPFFVTFATS
ncbi:MAG: hypothetical protein Ct9H300mP23_09020 [Nitrospinota bacterium]|nr:MAG: hypothetical protein Ct9H300mP23_09020 [Nitrospinota bacterium]